MELQVSLFICTIFKLSYVFPFFYSVATQFIISGNKQPGDKDGDDDDDDDGDGDGNYEGDDDDDDDNGADGDNANEVRDYMFQLLVQVLINKQRIGS